MAKILVLHCCYLEFNISDRGEKLQTLIEKLQTLSASLEDERKRLKAIVIVVKLLVRFCSSWQW